MGVMGIVDSNTCAYAISDTEGRIVTMQKGVSNMGNDLISRCKLFNALAPVQTLGEAYGVIQGLETEDAEYVKHGRWIVGKHLFRQCDRCGYERMDDNPNWDTNYCPNCGAKMDKEDGNDG